RRTYYLLLLVSKRSQGKSCSFFFSRYAAAGYGLRGLARKQPVTQSIQCSDCTNCYNCPDLELRAIRRSWMLGNLGLLLGLALLIFMALRGVNIFIAALLCSILVALSNGVVVPRALLEHFPFGPLGAFTFAGKFFVLFLCGAI